MALLALKLLQTASAAAAPGDATRLEYARSDHAQGCPDRDALKSAVVKRLGYDPFFPAARQSIVVEVTDAEQGLRARMRLVDEHGIIVGSRELSDKLGNCEELVASLALAISIALDPSAAPESSEESPPKATEPTQPVGAASKLEARPPIVDTPPETKVAQGRQKTIPPRARLTTSSGHENPIALRVAGFGSIGAAPAPALGFRFGASVSSDWARLVVEFADQLPASKTVEHVGGARASQLSATVAPCVAHGTLAACAVLNIGSLKVQGTQILDADSEHFLNVTAGVRFEYMPTLFGRLRLLTSVEVDKSLTPITLRVHGQQVWETPIAWPVLGLGLSWQFQ
jgi:hypothetical protein